MLLNNSHDILDIMKKDFFLSCWFLAICTSPMIINNTYELYILLFHESFFILLYSFYKGIFEKRYSPDECDNFLFYIILISCIDIVLFTQIMSEFINYYYYFNNFIILSFPIFVSFIEININNKRNQLVKQNIHTSPV